MTDSIRYVRYLLGSICAAVGILAFPLSYSVRSYSHYYQLASMILLILAVILFGKMPIDTDRFFKVTLLLGVFSTTAIWIVTIVSNRVPIALAVGNTVFWIIMVLDSKYQLFFGRLSNGTYESRMAIWNMLFGKWKAGRIYDEEESARGEEHKK